MNNRFIGSDIISLKNKIEEEIKELKIRHPRLYDYMSKKSNI